MKKLEGYRLEYYHYLVDHVSNVVNAWIDIRALLLQEKLITPKEAEVVDGLIIIHDSSKFKADEFEAYALYYSERSEANKIAFKKAWTLHKLRNYHHHQSLKDYQGNDWKCYATELVCDILAMGAGGTPAWEWYEKEKQDEKIDLPNKYRIFIEIILNLLKSRNIVNKQKSEQAHKV